MAMGKGAAPARYVVRVSEPGLAWRRVQAVLANGLVATVLVVSGILPVFAAVAPCVARKTAQNAAYGAVAGVVLTLALAIVVRGLLERWRGGPAPARRKGRRKRRPCGERETTLPRGGGGARAGGRVGPDGQRRPARRARGPGGLAACSETSRAAAGSSRSWRRSTRRSSRSRRRYPSRRRWTGPCSPARSSRSGAAATATSPATCRARSRPAATWSGCRLTARPPTPTSGCGIAARGSTRPRRTRRR